MRTRIAGLVCCSLLFACYKDMVRHTDVTGHGYCQYRITFTSPGAPMTVGQVICLYCSKLQFGGGECPATEKLRTEDGKQYDVAATGEVNGCQSCPGEAMEHQRVFELK